MVPVTFRETAQEAPAARLAPDRVTEDDPVAPVAVPPHVLLRLFGLATTKPAGKLSVNARPFSVVFWLGLLMAKLRVVVPLSGTVAAPNVLATWGGLITVRLAEEVLPFAASLESMVTLFE